MPTPKDSKVKPPDPRQLGLHIRGTFFLCPNWKDKPCALYVFQGVAPGKGNIPGYPKWDRQMRRWVKPRDPRTIPQLLIRSRFQQGVSAFLALTSWEKGRWNDEGRGRRMSGLNAFMQYWLRRGIEA